MDKTIRILSIPRAAAWFLVRLDPGHAGENRGGQHEPDGDTRDEHEHWAPPKKPRASSLMVNAALSCHAGCAPAGRPGTEGNPTVRADFHKGGSRSETCRPHLTLFILEKSRAGNPRTSCLPATRTSMESVRGPLGFRRPDLPFPDERKLLRLELQHG